MEIQSGMTKIGPETPQYQKADGIMAKDYISEQLLLIST